MNRLPMIASLLLATATVAHAQPDPGGPASTRPAATRPDASPAGESKAKPDAKPDRPRREAQRESRMDARMEGRPLERIRAVLEDLDLTQDQKSKVDSLFKETRESLQASAADREQLRETFQGFRGKLMEILTPDQRKTAGPKMMEAMRPGPGGPANPAGRRRTTETDGNKNAAPMAEKEPKMGDVKMGDGQMGDSNMGDSKMGDDAMMGGTTPSARSSAKEAVPSPKPPANPIAEVGQVAPDFTAKKLDGTPLKLANFKNRPVLLVFGSYSAPTFRDKAPQFAELAKDYKGRVDVVVVYTAEAYPATGAGGKSTVERNRDDRIAIEPHASEADRLTQAKSARAALKLDTVNVVVDDITDSIAKAYTNTPNAVVLIGKDGQIKARQNWADPFTLRATLDEQLRSGKPEGN